MRELPQDHRCPWREEAEDLRTELDGVKGRLEKLERALFGQRSEKMPPVADELRRAGATPDPALAKAKRRANAELKKELPEELVSHQVPAENRVCPSCGGRELKAVGAGKISYEIEFVPARFIKRKHVQESLACPCGEGFVTAEGPQRVYDKARYGPGFLANIAVAKCADSLPLYRLAKQIRRTGVPMSRSTLIDQFHRSASILKPIHDRMLEVIAGTEIVLADETTIQRQAPKKTHKSYVWGFIAEVAPKETLIAYRYSPSRSGDTPQKVLGGTKGVLVVDAYTGYNAVTTPEGRERVGCWAHARRNFFDIRRATPEAQTALDLILELYRVEHDAKAREIVRTPEHLALRRTRSAAILTKLRAWVASQRGQHLPRGAMGEALGYLENQWTELTRFVDDVRLPLDNNISERALRVVALGRKNFLFVGHDEGGENLAILYSLVASCEANAVDPVAYLTDVLLRVQTHPNSRIDELLPHRWRRAPVAPATVAVQA